VNPVTKLGYHLIVISPGEVVTVYLSIGGIVALCLAMPFFFYQLWKFVSPGLTPVEKKYSFNLLPIVSIMFLVGVAFAWFVIFPRIIQFLLFLSAQHFEVMLRAGAYFTFLSSICLPFGVIFELPIAVIFLTRLGIVSPRLLNKWRRYAYVIIVVLGVFISPPELISHLSVVLPMVALYELSILLSLVTVRKKQRKLDMNATDQLLVK
jgi:sec-independent protein translocase protein TatC